MLKSNLNHLNLGDITHGDSKIFDYEIFNDSDQTIIIQTSASCGCAKPLILPSNALKPQAKATVQIHYDSMGKSGLQNKRIWLDYSLHKNTERLTLSFVINVVNGDVAKQ